MKTAYSNRTLLIWALAQLVLAFALVVPFSLTPATWGGLLGFGVLMVVPAMRFDQKAPRVLAKILWALVGLLQAALVVYLMYALFFFAPDATAGYTAESRADIFAATLVPLSALCAVTLPSQALVACRSKADARRVTVLSVFNMAVAAALYGYETFAVKAVILSVDGIVGQLLGVVGAVIAVAITAVAFRGLFAQKGQQKTAPDEESEAAE